MNVSASVKKWPANLMKQQLSIAADVILTGGWDELTQKIAPKTQTQAVDPNYEHSCLLFSNLRYDVTESQIRKFISRVAKPIALVCSKMKSGRHVGKAYAVFRSSQV